MNTDQTQTQTRIKKVKIDYDYLFDLSGPPSPPKLKRQTAKVFAPIEIIRKPAETIIHDTIRDLYYSTDLVCHFDSNGIIIGIYDKRTLLGSIEAEKFFSSAADLRQFQLASYKKNKFYFYDLTTSELKMMTGIQLAQVLYYSHKRFS